MLHELGSVTTLRVNRVYSIEPETDRSCGHRGRRSFIFTEVTATWPESQCAGKLQQRR